MCMYVTYTYIYILATVLAGYGMVVMRIYMHAMIDNNHVTSAYIRMIVM